MLRFAWIFVPALATGCTTTQPVAPDAPPPPPALQEPRHQPVPDVVCTNPPPTERSGSGFREEAVREAVRDLVHWRLGEAALREVNAAPRSLMASFHQGLARPIECPGGRWAYAPPAVGAAVRTPDGWVRWRGGVREPYPPDLSAEIDRILADSAFWSEPAFDPPTCTDAGAQRLVVRNGSRHAVRQQSCGGRGLTQHLHRLVISGG